MNRLMDAMESGEVPNMLALQQSKGVGVTTTIKMYEFLHRGGGGEPHQEQRGLNFSE